MQRTAKAIVIEIKKDKMKTLKYKGKCIKMDERTWELFKKKRRDSGKSWNLFLLNLLEKK